MKKLLSNEKILQYSSESLYNTKNRSLQQNPEKTLSLESKEKKSNEM